MEVKREQCWEDIQDRALQAARQQRGRSGKPAAGSEPPLKRVRARGSTTSSSEPSRRRFAVFGRGSNAGGGGHNVGGDDSEEKRLREHVKGELDRYKSLFIVEDEVRL